ncbi:ribose-phosphate diphosphokinase family member [Holotrichia oblita]|nr:ribose-phosphate diphosphokinase family member [Holotrichia oblita]
MSSFVKGAAVLGVCGFIGKLLGAVYRIPLVNIIGAEGMGLYQMIFPMYALLLTAFFKRNTHCAQRANSRQAGKSILGVLCAAFVAVFARNIAAVQGNAAATLAYYGIAPSLIFVAIISAFRGYFQGKQNMVPSSVSQITEQAVKMVFGLSLAYLFLPYGLEYAVLGATLGVTVSELSSLVMLSVQYFLSKEKLPLSGVLQNFWSGAKSLYSLSIPITLGGIILPLTQLIDSSLVINLMVKAGISVKDATVLFGLSSGPVNSLINMPVVLSLAVATAVVPSIAASKARSDKEGISKKISLAMRITMLIVLPCAIFLALFSRETIDILYSGGLQSGIIDEPLIASQLLAISAVGIILVGFIQVSASILYALGKSMLPARNLAIGAVIKVGLNLLLLPRIGIYGVAISTVACYAVSFVLDIISLRRTEKYGFEFKKIILLPLLACAIMAAGGYGLQMLLVRFLHRKIAFIVTIFLSIALYGCSLAVTGALDEDAVSFIPFLNHNCNFGKIKTFDIPMLGKTIKQWVSLAFGETPVTYIENDRAKEIPELVREFLDDSEYTVILYSDTPLIQRKTVLEALEFTQKRGLNVCRMTRGYIFKTDFLRLQETLPENKRYYFSEEDDFICAADFKQLSLISEIMRRRILHHYMNNGVYVMDESTTYIDGDVVIESGVTIYPNNIIKGKTVIKSGVTLMQGNSIENCVIDSDAVITNSNLSTSYIGEGTSVGPFAYIRPETARTVVTNKNDHFKLFAGNACPVLALSIAEKLKLKLGEIEVGQFSDGETSVHIGESVRGSDVFVIQSTSSPVNDNLMELLVIIDALRRASAGRITAVIPYFGYARQDRKARARDPITAKLVADLITTAGADRVLTMDLHAPQLQGFFDIPVDHLFGIPVLAKEILRQKKLDMSNVVLVSPDVGSVARARTMAHKLNVPLAIVDKRRPKANMSEVMNVIGDVKGRIALILDDMIDTAGTIVQSAKALSECGALEVHACCTHAVLSGPALERLQNSVLKSIIMLDTIQKE